MTDTREKTVGVFLLVLINLFSVAVVANHERGQPIRRHGLGTDEISLYLKRFEGLKRVLPTHAVVGYNADREVHYDPNREVQEHRDSQEFFLARYALAPIILVRDANQQLVVGNYMDPARNCHLCESKDFILLNDFGDGVMLFRKSNK